MWIIGQVAYWLQASLRWDTQFKKLEIGYV